MKEVKGLVATGLKKKYGKKEIIRGIDLSLSPGEIVGLAGPNGAGKTTSFYMLIGLIDVDDGKIEFEGKDITYMNMSQRARLGISYLPQESTIFKGMTVSDNLMIILELKYKSKIERKKELDRLCKLFSIEYIRNSLADSLSGGERRRVEIARIMAFAPRYIFLDEPFAGIDPIAVSDMQKLIVQLSKMGIGILITDHNIREILDVVNRLYVIFNGKVLIEGSKEDILNDPNTRRVYLGEKFN